MFSGLARNFDECSFMVLVLVEVDIRSPNYQIHAKLCIRTWGPVASGRLRT